MDVAAGPIGEDEPEEKPKRGFAAWTAEEREAARLKSAETRARNKEEKGTPAARLETAEPRIAPKQPKGKKPNPVTTLDKQILVDALRLANSALDMTAKPEERWPDGPLKGQSYYSLSVQEVNQLADAWFEIAKRYSVFGSFLVAGRSLSVWGQALFVSYVVVGRRVTIATELRQRKLGGAPAGPTQAGGARPIPGDDGLRQDDAGAAAPFSN